MARPSPPRLALSLVAALGCRGPSRDATPSPSPEGPPAPNASPALSPDMIRGMRRQLDQGTRAAPTDVRPAARAPDPAMSESPAGSIAIGAAPQGVAYRWTSGDWVLRATVVVRNRGARAVDVRRDAFGAEGYRLWGPMMTFPERVTIPPGMTVTGDLEWYTGGEAAQPASLALTFAPGPAGMGWSRAVPLVPSPAPPAPGVVPAAPAPGAHGLDVTLAPPATTFAPGEGERVVRLAVRVRNATGAALRVPRSFFVARLGDQAGSDVDAHSTLPALIDVAPGAQAAGVVGWYWSGVASPPASVRVTFGPPRGTTLERDVPVTAGNPAPSPAAP